MSGLIYYQSDGQVVRAVIDPGDPAFYRNQLLVRTFGDVFGAVRQSLDALVRDPAEDLYSSHVPSQPILLNGRLGRDLLNGHWTPSPPDSVPEYAGARFQVPVMVTGFQFSSGVDDLDECPGGVGPCGHPTSFVLEGSDDGIVWTELLAVSEYAGMAEAESSPFEGDDVWSFQGRIFLSEVFDVPGEAYFLFYRMRVLDFTPNLAGGYCLTELIFYGRV